MPKALLLLWHNIEKMLDLPVVDCLFRVGCLQVKVEVDSMKFGPLCYIVVLLLISILICCVCLQVKVEVDSIKADRQFMKAAKKFSKQVGIT